MTDETESIQNVLRRLATAYAGDPNIQTIGYGLRYRGGNLSMERAIIFFVRRKYATERQIEAAARRWTEVPSWLFCSEVGGFCIRTIWGIACFTDC